MHFLGGAFVGAAPQLAYRLFLESLASRGVMVRVAPDPVACALYQQLSVPFEAGFWASGTSSNWQLQAFGPASLTETVCSQVLGTCLGS